MEVVMKSFTIPVWILLTIFHVLCNSFKNQTVKQSNTYWFTLEKEVTEPLLKILSSDERGVKLQLDISGFQIQDVVIGNVVYHKLSLPGGQTTMYVGHPQLPCVTTWISIPYGVEVTGSAGDDPVLVEDGYLCYPAQDAWAIFDNAPRPAFTHSQKTYATNAYFPKNSVLISKPFVFRGARFVQVSLFPIRYNPSKKTLAITETMHVDLAFSGQINKEQTAKNQGYLNEYFSWPILEKCGNGDDIVANLSPLPIYYELKPRTRYLIITHDNFYEKVLPLADWKTRKGLYTKVVKTSSLGAVLDTSRIRACIRDNFNESRGFLSYVLLVGDAPDYIPTCRGSTHPFVLVGVPGEPHESNPATDLYYTTILGDDFFPDLYIGRLAVKTATEAETVINKILSYETHPDTATNWPIEVLLATAYEAERTFIDLTFWIRDLLLTNSRIPHIIIDSLPSDPHINDSVANRINLGVGIMHHYDHGNSRNGINAYPDPVEGWKHPPFVVEDIPLLHNGTEQPAMFSMNCRSGWYDGASRDCHGEALLKATGKGVVGFIGSSRVSFDGYADELSKGIWKTLYPSYDGDAVLGPKYCLGELLNNGKLNMYNNFIYTAGAGYPEGWYIPQKDTISMEEFNLLGDPEMPVLTHKAVPLKVSHSRSITTVTTRLTVYAYQETRIGGIYERWPVPGARVCLYQNGRIYSVDYTASDGYVRFDRLDPAVGTVLITVTRHNYYPYLNNIPVTP